MFKAVLIDDDENNIKIIAKELTEYGVFSEIEIFTDTLVAIDAIRAIEPDVVFTDIEMPGMSGLELAKYIIDYNPTIKFVFIIAYDYYAIEAFELYAVDYLLKPIRKERLDQTIKRIMKKSISDKQLVCTEKIEVSVFGKIDVFKGIQHIRWRGTRTEEVFAYLLHNIGKKVMKDNIVDMIWKGYDYKQALKNMQTAICRLSQSLNELGNHIKIECFCNYYILKFNNVYFDYWEFENIIKCIDDINDENIYDAIKALEIYRGDYMEINGYIWSLRKRSAIKNRFYELYIKVLDFCDAKENSQDIMVLLVDSISKNNENGAIQSLLKKCQKKIRENILMVQLKYTSEYDAMTNTLNRKAGLTLLERSLQRISKEKSNLTICFLDINGMKEVNDVLGHNLGDELIITTVNCIIECIRSSDFIIRMGGDEFIVAFLDTDIRHAEQIWKRIENEYCNINLNMDRRYLVSISSGLIDCKSIGSDMNNGEYLNNMIVLADKKMYEMKKKIKKDLKIIR